ncbi:hypothetical protein AVEN_212777-1 [Araneus ventricosus]|uniref:Uncharacterized protein n=1 Tax=Araneus ventricosus TaxID=182803 RepID=A0A4Y2KW75_ARAVE|nr:hypothetical protein AVEN_212777-1 [Araneus ventricosus]
MVLFRTVYTDLILLDSPNCICDLMGDADHFTFDCSITKDCHLERPADAHKPTWYKALLGNKPTTRKLMKAFPISESICEIIKGEF